MDNNLGSIYEYYGWNDKGGGLTYEFDAEYEIGSLGLITTASVATATVKCWEENGTMQSFNLSMSNGISVKLDGKKQYSILTLPEAVKAKKIQFGLARGASNCTLVSIQEVRFYKYDGLLNRTRALYTDNLHTVLRDDVTQKTIDALREEVNTPDEF